MNSTIKPEISSASPYRSHQAAKRFLPAAMVLAGGALLFVGTGDSASAACVVTPGAEPATNVPYIVNCSGVFATNNTSYTGDSPPLNPYRYPVTTHFFSPVNETYFPVALNVLSGAVSGFGLQIDGTAAPSANSISVSVNGTISAGSSATHGLSAV